MLNVSSDRSMLHFVSFKKYFSLTCALLKYAYSSLEFYLFKFDLSKISVFMHRFIRSIYYCTILLSGLSEYHA